MLWNTALIYDYFYPDSRPQITTYQIIRVHSFIDSFIFFVMVGLEPIPAANGWTAGYILDESAARHGDNTTSEF